MDKRLVVGGFTSLIVLLSGCSGADYPTCYGPHVTYPDSKCGAYYYKTNFGSGGVTTQAVTECEIDEQRLGGNVVALHTLKHGVGLMQTRWEFQYRKASLLKVNGRVIST